jgi:hypothetical protein
MKKSKEEYLSRILKPTISKKTTKSKFDAEHNERLAKSVYEMMKNKK